MPSARDIVMPSGGNRLVPRTETNWQGETSTKQATTKSSSSKESKRFPRSEVLKRAPAPAAKANAGCGGYNTVSDDACWEKLDPEATDLVMSNSGPEFYIVVDRSSGADLGIEVEHYTEAVLMVMAINPGLIKDWNTSNPRQKMEEQDVIVGANDASGDVEKILGECRKKKPLRLSVRRPTIKPKKLQTVELQYKISLDKSKGAKLGIDVNHEEGKELFIESIEEGLVNKWNKEHPEQQVLVEDRIIEVNGVSGDVKLLLNECMKDEVLEMKLIHTEIQEET